MIPYCTMSSHIFLSAERVFSKWPIYFDFTSNHNLYISLSNWFTNSITNIIIASDRSESDVRKT